jgi:hypothetical protein
MSISITNTENAGEARKTRNVYDNYDNLLSVVKYDKNQNVDYILKTKGNSSGKNVETQKYEQVQIDINRSATNITAESARLRARIYKNDNSKVFETGFIYWVGNPRDNIIGKPRVRNIFQNANVFKGNFSLNVSDLQDNATYNYRAYVVHEYGTNYSDVKQFNTVDLTTIFSIAGNRFSGPDPLTVNLSAVNAGFGNYTYAWSMTGGSVGFAYPLNSITVTFSGEGYTPETENYTLESVTLDLSGSGYDITDTILVRVNGTVTPELTANLGLNESTLTYGITSVSGPNEPLSGYQTSNLRITFVAQSSASLFFVGMGDSNNSPYTDEALIASSIQSLNPVPEFMLHTGDINQEDLSAKFVDNFLPLWASSPLLSSTYLAFGNHDLQGGDYGAYLLDYLPATRESIGETNVANKKYCYDFVKGLCHFFVINTGNNNIQTQFEAGDPFADINGQLDEIIPKIEASDARWKIFVCHRPPYTNDQFHRQGFFNYSGTFWQNIRSRLNFANLGIDVVLNGHGQQYSVFQKDGVYFIQNGFGGANRRTVTEPFVPETIINITNLAGYIKYYVSFDDFRWEVIDVEDSDNIIDERTITKTGTSVTPASGTGVGSSYTVTRENKVLVNNVYQPSLSAVTYLDPESGLWALSAIQFLEGPIVYSTAGTRIITLSTNGPVTQPAILTGNSSISITNADYLTRTITHTFSGGGNYLVKAYAIIGNSVEKEAQRIIRVSGSSDYAPQWQTVLTSPFANNIIAAYDFRNLAGSVGINQYPFLMYDFEPNNLIGGYFGLVSTITPEQLLSVNKSKDLSYRSPFLPQITVGGFGNVLRLNAFSHIPVGIGGYDIAGYNINSLFGLGIIGEQGTALRFDPDYSRVNSDPFGGYPNQPGQSWSVGAFSGGTEWVWNAGRPFTLSMWINYNEFRDPGSKIFSSTAAFGEGEFSITQSTSALMIFKNTFLNEVVAGYGGTEPVADYFTGYPMLSTGDPAKMLTPNEWNHLVVTKDPNGIFSYYKNGELMLSDQGGMNMFDNNALFEYGFQGRAFTFDGLGGYASRFTIGNTSQIATNTAPPSGLIDSVSIWRKVLNQDEITELYNSGDGTEEYAYYKPIIGPKLWIGGMGQYAKQLSDRFDNDINPINTFIETDGDSFWNNVSLYAEFNGTEGSTDIVDSSTNALELSSNGVTISTVTKKFGDGSGFFDGNSYIETMSGEDYGAFGTDDFTVEWWEYLAGYNSNGFSPIIFYGNPGDDNKFASAREYEPQWGIARTDIYDASLLLFLGGYNSYTAGARFITGFANLSSWTHNAIVRNNGAFSYYLNGFRVGTYNLPDINITNLTPNGVGPGTGTIGGAFIGGYGGEEQEWRYFNGYLDEIRITKGVARYTANFTVPTTAYPTDLGDFIGTRFKPTDRLGGSFAVAQETVPVTYPHTIAFVGKANITTTDRTIFQNIQTTYSQNVNIQLGAGDLTERAIYSRGEPFGAIAGLSPSNSQFGTSVGGYFGSNYTPTGNEWFYISYSFLGPNNNNLVRYYLQTPSLSDQGTINAHEAPAFNGIPGFGLGGYAIAGYVNFNSVENFRNSIDGIARLGIYINQGFNTHEDMVSLFQTITAGPANDLPLLP